MLSEKALTQILYAYPLRGIYSIFHFFYIFHIIYIFSQSIRDVKCVGRVYFVNCFCGENINTLPLLDFEKIENILLYFH